MSDDPCKQLKEEYEAALIEYDEASQTASAFVSFKTLEELDNSHPLDGEEVGKAYDRRDAAREKYEKAMKAYFECRNKNRTNS
jgi:hypothetical protein